jgi:nitroreductase
MEMINELNNRRSRRKYLDKDIPNDTINEILKCALNAPYGGKPDMPKCQVSEFIVVRDKGIIKKLALRSDCRQFVPDAPVIIACCANKDHDPDYKEWIFSAALSIQNLITAAEAKDIGSCILSCFLYHKNHIEDKAILRNALHLPDHIELVALVTLGYKDESEEIMPKILRPFSEVISYDTFGKKNP